jgi:hypothetical protein
MPFKKGEPRLPNAGRKKGDVNKVTKAFNEALARLLDEPETLEKLRELRDSDEPMDRSTFWRIAGKRVPSMIEAKFENEVRLRIIDHSDQREDSDAD